MKVFLGLLMLIGGIAFGAYMGLWICFVGGIIDIINAVKAPELSAAAIAIGALKIICTGIVGYLSAALVCLPGYVLIHTA